MNETSLKMASVVSQRSLDDLGRPGHPKGIYLGVKQRVAASVDYVACLKWGLTVSLPVRWLGGDFFVVGRVTKIELLPTGRLIHLSSRFVGGRWTNLNTYQDRLLWLPDVGGCGFI